MFKSANLKVVWEELRIRGYPVSASEAGHLFHYGQLKFVLDHALANIAQVKALEARIRMLQAELTTLDPASKEYANIYAALADTRAKYRHYRYRLDAHEIWF